MTNMVEPRGAADDQDPDDRAGDESELTSLVRRWMAGNRGLERSRREGTLRVAPAPPRPGAHRDTVEAAEPTSAPAADVADVTAPVPRAPTLPHRPSPAETGHARRMAVLIDARRVVEDVATGLLARLGERGSVAVCRAYADWNHADLGAWVGSLRRQGLHSFHQFADDDDQALVAMAIDAIDIAREAAVDEVVIAGDMTSMLPLVHRLHAAGVRVVVVGPAHTPHDVRAACDDFIDVELLAVERPVVAGRHRA